MAKIYGVDVGNWYQTADGRIFRIVSVDRDDDAVEVQYVDGDLEEIDVDSWYDIEPMPIDGASGREAVLYDTLLDRDAESDDSTLSDVLGRIEYNH